MTRPRFFAPGLDPSAAETVLTADESHHLASVLRLGTGDEVSVFDGNGHEYLARVERADRKRSSVRVLDAIAVPPDPVVRSVLVQAVLKGDKMDNVVRDATMAGVAEIVPIVTERTIANAATRDRSHAVERWQRVVIASAKQCRRARLPIVHPLLSFGDWLHTPFDGLRLLFAEPSACEKNQPARDVLGGERPYAVACLVGPEGGWSDGERDAAIAAGCLPVTLGTMTLRADAAGLVALSLVSFAFEA